MNNRSDISLPLDPKEAAATLLELFENRGGWPKSDKSWDELNEKECAAVEARHESFEKRFGWIRQFYESFVTSHTQINTNDLGVVHCFRWWAEWDEGEVCPPNGFIVYLTAEQKLEEAILYRIYQNTRDTDPYWDSVPLLDHMKEYQRSYA